MNVIIPVAGKGSRMRPFTHTKPKPLLPVAGKPMVTHIIDAVLPLKPTKIFLVVGYLGEQFREVIPKLYPDQEFVFVEQKEAKGPGNAIKMAESGFDEDILIIYSDTIFKTDLSVIKNCENDGIFWAKEVEDPSRFGVLLTDENNIMTKIVEKPKEFVSNLANVGMYYVKNGKLLGEGIEYAHENPGAGGEVWLTDAFAYMIEKGEKIEIVPIEGWYDCGKWETTLQTNADVLALRNPPYTTKEGVTIIPPVAIDPTATITNSTIGPNVTVGAHVRIERSTISDAIIDEHSAVIDSHITHSIIGEHALLQGKEGKFCLGDHSHAVRD